MGMKRKMTMKFNNVYDALRALEDLSASPDIHLQAIHYLGSLDACEEAESLVRVLINDDVGVRWEAGNLLARMGRKSIPSLLRALVDPNRVENPRLREGALHTIHGLHDQQLKQKLHPLAEALKGPSPDVQAMLAANRLLAEFKGDPCQDEAENNQKTG